jgi:hypothetical protein
MHLGNFSQGLLHKGEKGGGAAIQVVDENTGSKPALFTQNPWNIGVGPTGVGSWLFMEP